MMGEAQALKKAQSVILAGVLAMTLGCGLSAGAKAYADDSLQAGAVAAEGTELGTQINIPSLKGKDVIYPGYKKTITLRNSVDGQTGTWIVASEDTTIATAKLASTTDTKTKLTIRGKKAGVVNIKVAFKTDAGVVGELEPITMTVTGKKVAKNANRGALTYKVTHNNYDPINGAVQVSGLKKADAAKAWIPTTIQVSNRTYLVRSVKANAFRNTDIKSVTVGKNVKKLGAKMLKNSAATKLFIKSKLLTEDSVKNCLAGSKIKTVKVNAASFKAYSDIFTKDICGKDVKVVKA